MRRGGPPAHSAATPEFVELPVQLSWTEIPNIWARLSRVHRAAKHQATTNQQVLTDGRSQNLAIGGDQPPLIILTPTRGACDKRPQLGRAGPFPCSGPGCRC